MLHTKRDLFMTMAEKYIEIDINVLKARVAKKLSPLHEMKAHTLIIVQNQRRTTHQKTKISSIV